MMDVLFVVAAVLYLVASAQRVAHLAGAGARPGRVATAALVAGAACHLAHDALRWQQQGVAPFAGIAPALSSLAWMVTVSFLVLRRWRPRLDVLGAFVTPAALVMLLASRAHTRGTLGRGALFATHIAANLFGLAAFTVACAMAVAYLLQERQVKARSLGGLFHRLPPLAVLDTLTHRCIVVGLPALTVGVVTGHIVAARSARVGGLPWQQYFAMISWAVFVTVLLLRVAAGWRGRRAAIGTILGYASSVLVLLFYVLRGGQG